MFGDETLIGLSKVNVDCKGRMFLPAKTKREKGDKLVLVYDKDIDKYIIYKLEDIESSLKFFSEKINKESSALKIVEWKKRELEFSRSILKNLTVDAQGRIQLMEPLTNYKSLILVGCRDHLIIEMEEEDKIR